MSKKMRAAIIGVTDTGLDLLSKIRASDLIEAVRIIAHPDAENAAGTAKALPDLAITIADAPELLARVKADAVDVVFFTSPIDNQAETISALNAGGVLTIDMTASGAGAAQPFIPALDVAADGPANRIDLGTYAAQATASLVAAISGVQDVDYAEVVATAASETISAGVRRNVDDVTRFTASAMEAAGKAKQGKAIILINPANPPLRMRATIHALTDSAPRQDDITLAVQNQVGKLVDYISGYRLVNGPVFDGNRVSIFIEIEASGEVLPAYAGNLAIMSSAAFRAAESFACKAAAGTAAASTFKGAKDD